MSTPEIRGILFLLAQDLALALLVLGVLADDPDDAPPAHNLAFFTPYFD
jgi:hypothetical protein